MVNLSNLITRVGWLDFCYLDYSIVCSQALDHVTVEKCSDKASGELKWKRLKYQKM